MTISSIKFDTTNIKTDYAEDFRKEKISKKTNAVDPYLPVEFENDKGASRWYRKSDKEVPGIVVDSGQKKHIYGDLFGHYQGKRQSMFSPEDSTSKALSEILGKTLKSSDCDSLNKRPEKLDENGICIKKSITVDQNKSRYPKITIQDPTYVEKSDAWYLHFYPEKY